MQTPVYDYLKHYAKSDSIRMHMPGHKGRSFGTWLGAVYPLDITEIDGADSLFDAAGILAQSEQNAASLFHTKATCYSAGGSTLCIQAMLALMKQEGRTVVAARNVHSAFLSACVLLGLEVVWVYPQYTGGILSGTIQPADIERALLQLGDTSACVYLTSPDYLGKRADIARISAVCRRNRAPLLVDNAHGPHLAFLEQNKHPIALGADLCCDSAHKTLPALTGAAYLHIGNACYLSRAKAAMSLFGSTSPSYLILASLDLCNRYIDEQIRRELADTVQRLDRLRRRIAPPYRLYHGEPLHLTICAAQSGMDGLTLARKLRLADIACEYADHDYVVLLCSSCTTPRDLDKLESVLLQIPLNPPAELIPEPAPPVLTAQLPMRDAALCAYQTIPVEESVGRICAAVHVPCPPAIPIAVSGEEITADCVNIFKRYGISSVNVVK